MAVVWEHVWAYLRKNCNSFPTMSGHVVFSVIFTLNAVSVIKEDFSHSIDKADSVLTVTTQLLANQVYFYST